MESLERKTSNTVPNEPIKSEEIMASPSASDRSNVDGSPPPHCSICLGRLINNSFTDSCLHQFCFTCLLQWSKIKTECPLCKQTFKSIIHNVRSEGDYDQYDVNLQAVAATLDVAVGIPRQWEVMSINISPLSSPARNFMYRTTMGSGHHRRYNGILNPDAVARREQIPSHAPQLSRNEIRHRNVDPLHFRMQVYRQGIWAADLPDAFGRFHESSADFYRRHPEETHRLVPWLNRELQVLLDDNHSHIAYVINVIMDTITVFNISSAAFRNVVRPYFLMHTDQFVHEFSNFARSNFDLVGYDQSVVYPPHNDFIGHSNQFVSTMSPQSPSSSDSDSDSDVRLVEDNRSNRSNLNSMPVGPHLIDMPGPSSVGQTLQLTTRETMPDVSLISPVIYTISSSDESDNECEVIGYVKPRHERTPEVINLDTSENEILDSPLSPTSDMNDPIDPFVPPHSAVIAGPSGQVEMNINRSRYYNNDSRSYLCQDLSSSAETDMDQSSDYNPQYRSRRRTKKLTKSSSRKINSRKRKNSSSVTRKRARSRRDCSWSDRDTVPIDMPSTSRGYNRYTSDQSESERPRKRSKRTKETRSSKKSKRTKLNTTSKYTGYTSSSSSLSHHSDDNVDFEEPTRTECQCSQHDKPWYSPSQNYNQYPVGERTYNSEESNDFEYLETVKFLMTMRNDHSSDSDHCPYSVKAKKRKEIKKHRRSRR